MKNPLLVLLIGLGFGASAALAPVAATAQATGSIEEIVTIGTRAKARTAQDSLAPVDVISGAEFENQGDSDLSNLLRNVVPSFNVNVQPISDGATIVRPPNLRGLAPDHTLVLVNGKRRHRGAVIVWLGSGISDGSQGPDISAIPAIAIKQVEVLRDGAAAQYGSDAIAGVMNFQLKDYADGGAVEVRYGETSAGDGAQYRFSGNIGLPLTDAGFINASLEYGHSDPTDRAVQRNDAQALIDRGNMEIPVPAQIWGSPEVKDDLKLWFNSRVDLNANNSLYAHGNYVSKTVDGGFYFRHPNRRTGVFGSPLLREDANGDLILDANGSPIPELDANGNPLRLLLVGDLLDAADGTRDGSAGCPQVRVSGALVLEEDRDEHAAVLANPNCFTYQKLFPGGFTPRFGGDLVDFSAVGGLEGETDLGDGVLGWDFSAGVGQNNVDYFIYNTINASLGADTPLSFDPGANIQTDINVNADFTYAWGDFNFALGYEWREEEFEIRLGGPASYTTGPLTAQGFLPGSNGFSGFGPLAAGVFSRRNHAVYGDIEWDVTADLLLGAAVRHEEFSDFGGTTNWKVAGNWRVTDSFGVRATASTGFKAPTPGQSNSLNITTAFNAVLGDVANEGVIPSTSELAKRFGGEPLQPEESLNLTVGVLLSLGPVDLTADYFNIEVENRLNLTRNIVLTESQTQALLAEGITSARGFQTFRFFINDFDTETQGVDVVATWPWDWSGGSTELSLAYNYTDTKVKPRVVGPGEFQTVDANRIKEIQDGVPDTRWSVSLGHDLGAWRLLARASYYSGWHDPEAALDFGGEALFDLEAAYSLNDRLSFTAGAQNLFNEKGDKDPLAADRLGAQYSQWTPWGFDGTFWYVRARYDFDY